MYIFFFRHPTDPGLPLFNLTRQKILNPTSRPNRSEDSEIGSMEGLIKKYTVRLIKQRWMENNV